MAASKHKVILCVEDDAGMAVLMRTALEQHGYLVEIKHSMRSALLSYNPQMHEALVIDYCLTDHDGLELIDRMQSSMQPLPPMVMVSGRGNKEIAEQAKAKGCFCYVEKDSHGNFIKELPVIIGSAIQARAGA